MRMLVWLALLATSKLAAAEAPVVVLDAGHGGSNRGAFGPASGLHEKTLTLHLARATSEALRRHLPNARVLMTRDRDEYLTLEQRVRFANRHQATLFVSLHLNASTSRARQGFATFVLNASETRRQATLALAHRHGGDVIQTVVADLRRQSMHLRSIRLAQTVHARLRDVRGAQRDRGLHQGGFDVLLGLNMPGVLVEFGYLDHAEEGAELARPALQSRLAEALARAIAATLRAR